MTMTIAIIVWMILSAAGWRRYTRRHPATGDAGSVVVNIGGAAALLLMDIVIAAILLAAIGTG